VALSIASYAWVRFSWSRYSAWLLAALGFCSFGILVTAGVMVGTVFSGRTTGSQAAEWLFAASRIAAASMLLAATATRNRQTRRWGWKDYVRVVSTCTGACGGVITVLVAFAARSPGFLTRHSDTARYLVALGPDWVAALACGAAALFCVRRAHLEKDRHARLACFWLSPTAVACLMRGAMIEPSAGLWWQAYCLDLAAAAVATVGMSIHSAHATNRSMEEFAGLKAVHEISLALAAAPNLSALFPAFVEAVAKIMNARIVTLYLLDDTASALHLEATRGDDGVTTHNAGVIYSLEPEPRPGFHSGHTAAALMTREMQVAQDVHIDVEFVPWRTVARSGGWAVSAPLVSRNASIGVLNIYLGQEHPVSADQLDLLSMIAALASPAIDSRRRTPVSTPDEGSEQLPKAA